MLFELSITPLSDNGHISDKIADVVNIIDEKGLPYELTPAGTCIEGSWDEVMPVVRECHEHVRDHDSHVITDIKIEDDGEAENQLEMNVKSVKEKM